MAQLKAVVCALGLLSAATLQQDASACGNEIYGRLDLGIAWANVTEGKLNRGKNKEVVETVLARNPLIHTVKVSGDLITNRALRIIALAVVRLEGDVPRAAGFPSKTPEQRAANLSWAIDRLRKLQARRPKDATLKCDLAEALASQPQFHAEAFALLDNLEQRDLVVSSEGYAALAKLRAARGQAGPAWAAAPAAQLNRPRALLAEARSELMRGKRVPRPMAEEDLAKGRAASSALRARPGRRQALLNPSFD